MRENPNFKRASRLGITAAVLAATLLGAGAAPAQARPGKLCNPGPTPSITINDDGGFEAAGTGELQVRLSNPACWTVKVHYSTSDMSATVGFDYVQAQGDLVFSPGTTQKFIPLELFPDNKDEQPEETFAVNLSSASGATIADNLGIMTIWEGDVVEPG